jgi:hypothetical protein
VVEGARIFVFAAGLGEVRISWHRGRVHAACDARQELLGSRQDLR